MNNSAFNSYESILNIIEFYRIQPRIQDFQIEKIEEYLILMSAHYQESLREIDDCIGLSEPVCLEDIVDVLNSYLNKVGEELEKIFPENINVFSPINIHSNAKIIEIQALELYRNFNGGESDLYRIKEALDCLDNNIYEEDFAENFALLTKDILSKINSDLIVKVDDLL
ncbi:hypothetical protein [Labilibaculum sp.]|uniref:hypothetical protein n=1 Tax=Labilibaculum sp. TaxID=2060723 RepID=UPI002AA80A33|nr:hypothetical protein [Labilibaculum sp.]MBN2595231.1 hypothetical protein [Marinifilaceae bacterium]